MILKKIAELANEADRAGLTEIADALDAIVQEAYVEKVANTVGSIADEMIDADTMSRNKLDEAISKGIEDATVQTVPAAQPSAGIDENHAILEGKLRKIQKHFTDFGGVAPFMLPAGKLGGNAIRLALESIGIKNYKTWGEINSKLDTYLSGLVKRDSDKIQSAGPVASPLATDIPLHKLTH